MLNPAFDDPSNISLLVKAIHDLSPGEIKIMEVCGTHTMSIAKSGIKTLLPDSVKLISGPGCPVCVTPSDSIDSALSLSERDDLIIASYGDMIRVPGSVRGDTLLKRRAMGADIRIVYSPVDAVDIAKGNPDKQVVFLGVGFETTAPGTCAAIDTAIKNDISNFSVFSMLKRVEPALRAIIEKDGFDIDGFLCPGHVATIMGENGFIFLEKDYHIPAVISGFEPADILSSIYKLISQIKSSSARLENEYTRAVSKAGNTLAVSMIDKYLSCCDTEFRGLGMVPSGGFCIRDDFSAFDAEKRFPIKIKRTGDDLPACRCASVIIGREDPLSCPFFASVCTPEDPIGPCMVSSEGACAAAYKYRSL